MLNNKKFLMSFMLYCIFNHTHAEVLVILPESGAMARAGLSIKQGFMSAYQASGMKIPIKFVNSDKIPIAQLLKENVNSETQIVVGPLARNDVDALIQTQPMFRVLALNEVSAQSEHVWQFSLSKKDDAAALHQVLNADKLQQLYVLHQHGMQGANELFLKSLMAQAHYPVSVIDEMPQKFSAKSGVLLLGNNAWVNSHTNLPNENIYVLPNAIEELQSIPQGVKFCDTPALYLVSWADVVKAYQQSPVSMPYQRLLAFGGDAWHITQQYLNQPDVKDVEFQGQTGWIKINNNQIRRVPQCYQNTKKGLKVLS